MNISYDPEAIIASLSHLRYGGPVASIGRSGREKIRAIFRGVPAIVKFYNVRRFAGTETEARRLQQLEGIPGIPKFLDQGTLDIHSLGLECGTPYVTAAYVEGDVLGKAPITPAVAQRIFDTMDRVHERGIQYRDGSGGDLRIDDFIVAPDGQPYFVDLEAAARLPSDSFWRARERMNDRRYVKGLLERATRGCTSGVKFAPVATRPIRLLEGAVHVAVRYLG